MQRIIQSSIITYDENNTNPSSKIIDLDRYLNRYESLNFIDTSDKDIKISKEKALALWNKEISPYGYPNHQKMHYLLFQAIL